MAALKRELTRQSYMLGLLPRVFDDKALSEPFAALLSDRQLAWQAGQHDAISEARLLAALNSHFELERSPLYLRFQPHELRRVRLIIRLHVPELSTNADRIVARPDADLLSPVMSPAEVYLASNLLLFQKSFDHTYVRAPGETRASDDTPRNLRRGVHALSLDPRNVQFQDHIARVAESKWNSPDAALKALAALLDGGVDDER